MVKAVKIIALVLCLVIGMNLFTMELERKRPAENELNDTAAKKSKKALEAAHQLLFCAAFSGDLNSAIVAQAAGADLNISATEEIKDKGIGLTIGSTPLMHAAKHGKLCFVRFLLDEGVSIDSTDSTGKTALHIAAANGYAEIGDLLLDRKANIEARTTSGETPLCAASINGYKDLVKHLLERGAKINVILTDPMGATPLYMAIKNNYPITASFLIENGADVNVHTADGNTPLSMAVKNGNEALVCKLLDYGADVNPRGNVKPLCEAARIGHASITCLLLNRGADVDTALNDGETSLHIAASLCHMPVVQLLLERGANPNAVITQGPRTGWQPGNVAAKSNVALKSKESIMELLLLYGAGFIANENLLMFLKSRLNMKPLVFTAGFCSIEDLNHLLKEYDSRNLEHLPVLNSALKWALVRGELSKTKLLLEKGAQIDDALKLIIRRLMQPNSDIQLNSFNLLIAYKSSTAQNLQALLSDLLAQAVEANKPTVVELLLKHGAPAHKALEVLDKLLAVPLCLDYRNKLLALYKLLKPHASLLQLILRYGQPNMRKTLQEGVEQGVLPNELDEKVTDRIMQDIKRFFIAVNSGNLAEVKSSIESGIDANIKDAQGRTALWITAERGHVNLVEYLLTLNSVVINPLNLHTGITLMKRLKALPDREAIIAIVQKQINDRIAKQKAEHKNH